MDWTFLTAALAFTTIFAFVAVAFISKRKTQERMQDDDARKSTLAADQRSDARPADV